MNILKFSLLISNVNIDRVNTYKQAFFRILKIFKNCKEGLRSKYLGTAELEIYLRK